MFFFFSFCFKDSATNGEEQVSLVHSTHQIQLESGQGSNTHFDLMDVYLNIHYTLGTGDISELEKRRCSALKELIVCRWRGRQRSHFNPTASSLDAQVTQRLGWRRGRAQVHRDTTQEAALDRWQTLGARVFREGLPDEGTQK